MLSRVQIAVQCETISNVMSQRTMVNTFIQVALSRVYQFYDWPYYLDYKNGIVKTIADYSIGTASAVQGSNTITGSGTTWTSAMVGRKIRIGTNKIYYRITAVGGVGSLTIDNNYQNSSVNNSGYDIYKDEYLINADVDKYKSLKQTQNALMMIDMIPANFDEQFTMPTSFADPFYGIDVGNGQGIYNAGTISITGTTLTGIGTTFTTVEGLGKGSKILELTGNNWYTVKTINSDTSITTYETAPTPVSGASYQVNLNNITVQCYPIPIGNMLYYRYYRLPAPLVNDYDLPDMPYDYHHLLIWGALSEVLSQKGDINKAENVYETRFMAGLNQMKLKIGGFAPDRKQNRKNADAPKRSYTRGLESPAYDRRYSW